MSDRTCTIEGCTGPEKARGLCPKHLTRLMRRGTTDEGRPYGRTSCSQPECDLPHYSKHLCQRHYATLRRLGDPALNRPIRSNDIGYVAAHNRVYAARGKATDYACHWCGNSADQWAYDHSDPGEKRGSPKNLPYSPDPARYLPACRSCHVKLDRWSTL